MSIESAKLYIEKIKTDKEFARKVMECKDTETRAAFVRGAGFDFTFNELKEKTARLTDNDMEFISGGGSSKCCTPYMEFIQ